MKFERCAKLHSLEILTKSLGTRHGLGIAKAGEAFPL